MKVGIIFATQRTGTTLLRSIINTHPKVKVYGELFLDKHTHMDGSYFTWLKDQISQDTSLAIPSEKNVYTLYTKYLQFLKDISSGYESLVFDCKYNSSHIFNSSLHDVFDMPNIIKFAMKENLPIFHIQRTNLLANLVSSLLTNANQVWATEDITRIKVKSVTINTKSLIKNLENREKTNEFYISKLINYPNTIFIKYENMIENGKVDKQLLKEISRKLNVSNEFNPVPQILKIQEPLEKSIFNYKDVCKILENTKYETFLQNETYNQSKLDQTSQHYTLNKLSSLTNRKSFIHH